MKKQSDFTTKQDFFAYLVANKKEIIKFKKSEIKNRVFYELPAESGIAKSLTTSHRDDIESGIIERSIFANTYYWLDSHQDVHVENTFAKSISEKGDDVWFLHDHVHQLDAKIGKHKSIYEKPVAWKDLNVNIPGSTVCLLSDVSLEKTLSEKFFLMYLKGEINQHSVGMQYVIIDMAINDPEYKEEYATYIKYIDKIGNKDKVNDLGFFFAVKEAKLIEISCVLAGSNELTMTMPNVPKSEPPAPEKSFFASLVGELTK